MLHDMGVCLLDKPLGLSSNQAVQKVKRLLKAKKAGHTGSLDPLATGLLPICLGQATRFAQFLLHANKLYQVTAQVGAMTTTADAEGDVINHYPIPSNLAQRLTRVLPQFMGDIEQIPPMYSALKHQGKRLYQWAREGVEVERAPRHITIHQLELLDCQTDQFTLQVHCSSGTYIRTLIEDIAMAMDTGAYVQSLRRLAIGDCTPVTMMSLSQLTDDLAMNRTIPLMPVDWLVNQWPKVQITREQAGRICQGQIIDWLEPNVAEGWVQIWQQQPKLFIGMGQLNQQRLAPKRLLNSQ
ncbi:MAG: tRNA pseudouridine(55) synthase TruB [Legionellales bacterium]|nr:tRNA pseudouridine(55) synthase TruB [Legionellales bacterium]